MGGRMFAPDPPLLPRFFCSGLGMSEDSRDFSPSSQVRGWGVCWAFCGQALLCPGTGRGGLPAGPSSHMREGGGSLKAGSS